MPALSKEQREFLETTASTYASHLGEAEGWLEERGIDLDHARYEGLGVVRDQPSIHDGYRGRLAIPYITEYGVVAMSFRCLRDHKCKEAQIGESDGKAIYCSKYKKIKGQETHLYGVRSFDEASDWIAITEGELDSLVLRQIGIPAIAIPGAENWKDHWSNVLEDMSRIYVFADADTAGKKMFDRVRDKVSLPVIRVKLPEGEDVNSTYVKYGAESLIKRVKK